MKRILWGLLILLSLIVSGCGAGGQVNGADTGGGGGDGTGTGTDTAATLKTVELSGPTSLTAKNSAPSNPENSQGLFICTLKDSNDKPIKGMSVKFTSSFGGTFSPLSDVTDENGQVSTTYTAPTALGTTQISALVSLRKSNEIAVTLQPGPPKYLEMYQSAKTVGPKENVEFTVTVQDNNNFPVMLGTTVSAVVGTNASGALGYLGPVSTNASGIVKLSYTAGQGTGTDIVKAQTGSPIGMVYSNELSVEVSQSAAAVASLALFSPRDATSPLIANGTDTAKVTATIKDSDGLGVNNLPVTFTVVSPSGTVDTKEITPLNDGNAVLTIDAGTKTGEFQISASIEAGLYKSLNIPVKAGAAATDQSSISQASGLTVKTGQITTLIVVAKDANGNAVAGENLIFDVAPNNSNASVSPAIAMTDALGRASVDYTAGAIPSASGDKVSVQFASGGFTKTTGSLIVEAEELSDIELTLGASEAIANGTTQLGVTATLTDINGKPVPSGINVAFTTTAGTLSAPTAITNASGIAKVILTSPVNIGDAIVTASAQGFIKTVPLKFIAGPVNATKSSVIANPASIPADSLSTSTVTVTLYDANGNPAFANGTLVTLFASGGTITSGNPVNLVSGKASFTVKSELGAKTVTLSADLFASMSGSLSFAGVSNGTPANILLAASQTHLFVSGVGQVENTTITARIVDISGVDVPAPSPKYNNLRVSWVTHPGGGEFLAGTDSAGAIKQIDDTTSSMDIYVGSSGSSLSFQSGTLPGVIEVKFEALGSGGVSLAPKVLANLPQLVISSGPPHTIVLTTPILNAIENLTSGVYRRKGMAVVTDRYGNAVPDGTTINFGLVDSVIAQGNVDSTIASTLTDSNPTLADGTATSFTTASIDRNDVKRFIQGNDRVLILGGADAQDKSRHEASKTATTLTVNKAYTANLSGASYVVGASLLGGFVDGCTDAARQQGNLCSGTFTTGQGIVKDGLIPFRVTYPADGDAIMTGFNSAYDTRVSPIGSAQVYVVAASSDNSATTIKGGEFAFAPIVPLALAAVPGSLTGTGGVSLTLRDGGDTVPVPFYGISSYVEVTTKGKFEFCVDPDKTSDAACDGALIWYLGGGGLCYDKFITETAKCLSIVDDPLTLGVNEAATRLWVKDIPDLFDIDVYIGDSTTANMSTGTMNLATDYVDTDLDGNKDFYIYPVTMVGGATNARIMVRGGTYIKSGDAANVVFMSGDATTKVTVKIP